MLKLTSLIEKSIEIECLKRNFVKLKMVYYTNINEVFDGTFDFRLSTYKGFRVVDVQVGVSHKEEERLKVKFMNEKAAVAYKKNWIRWSVETASLMGLIREKEGGPTKWFEYYDEHPDLISETTTKMFDYIDKYAMPYLKEMSDIEAIINSYLHNRGHVYYHSIQDIPFLYLISGRRDKAVAFIEEKLREMPNMENWLKKFCYDFLEYDYDADPDKLPVK